MLISPWCCLLLSSVLASPTFGLIPSLPVSNSDNSQDSCPIVPGNPIASFSSNPVVANLFGGFISIGNKTFVCEKASESDEKQAVQNLNMYFCHGPTIADCESQPLSNATKLLTSEHYDSSKTSLIFIGGWQQGPSKQNYTSVIIAACYANGKFNCFVFDWYYASKKWYPDAVALMPAVAKELAAALDAMKRSVPSFNQIGIVGHSLGAHMAGMAARLTLDILVSWIMGLDPAGPMFYETMITKCQDGLRATDAAIVNALHSDWGRFGGNEMVGKVDYIANLGHYIQPGCNSFDVEPKNSCTPLLCSHIRSLYYYCEALRQIGSVMAIKCESGSAFKATTRDGGPCAGNPTHDVTVPNNGCMHSKTNQSDCEFFFQCCRSERLRWHHWHLE